MNRLEGATVGASPDAVHHLRIALQAASYSYTFGSTHGFYHYPARFSPDIARTAISLFSRAGDYVLDPFAGGGTAVIEGLSLGRRMVGIDLNALAHFITKVRTTPLSAGDEHAIVRWAERCAVRLASGDAVAWSPGSAKNLPGAFRTFIGGSLELTGDLGSARQRAFARCVLLRLGQWALDCRDFGAPRRCALAAKLPGLTDNMLGGLQEFVAACRAVGVRKAEVTRRRLLLCRDTVGIQDDPRIRELEHRPTLVLTSPPYPGVHVLYHRWQYRGRKETAAPYWIANVPDGHYESYYTGGSRTPTGRRRYFEMITGAFRSVRQVLDPGGLVVQLVGFSDTSAQLPQFLKAMEEAGFEEWTPAEEEYKRLGRHVPNRKWYAKLKGRLDAASELLLFHRSR